MVIRYRGKKPSLAIPIALTVIGVGVLFLILIVAPYLSHSLFGSISGEHATLVGSLIGAFAGIVGIVISGILGLTIVRRDRYDAEESEFRALCAAIGGELSDASGIFKVWAYEFDRLKTVSEKGAVLINTSEFPLFSTHVYVASCDRLGLLGPELARDIVLLYGRIMVWAGDQKKTYELSEIKWSAERLANLSSMTEDLSNRLYSAAGFNNKNN